ncbi:MAG: hypothetical protein KBD07_00990 [Candidatus Omnitrophica bacterium]|nr:hypothetical protein [Candidatus Omnitrophota bacterium]
MMLIGDKNNFNADGSFNTDKLSKTAAAAEKLADAAGKPGSTVGADLTTTLESANRLLAGRTDKDGAKLEPTALQLVMMLIGDKNNFNADGSFNTEKLYAMAMKSQVMTTETYNLFYDLIKAKNGGQEPDALGVLLIALQSGITGITSVADSPAAWDDHMRDLQGRFDEKLKAYVGRLEMSESLIAQIPDPSERAMAALILQHSKNEDGNVTWQSLGNFLKSQYAQEGGVSKEQAMQFLADFVMGNITLKIGGLDLDKEEEGLNCVGSTALMHRLAKAFGIGYTTVEVDGVSPHVAGIDEMGHLWDVSMQGTESVIERWISQALPDAKEISLRLIGPSGDVISITVARRDGKNVMRVAGDSPWYADGKPNPNRMPKPDGTLAPDANRMIGFDPESFLVFQKSFTTLKKLSADLKAFEAERTPETAQALLARVDKVLLFLRSGVTDTKIPGFNENMRSLEGTKQALTAYIAGGNYVGSRIFIPSALVDDRAIEGSKHMVQLGDKPVEFTVKNGQLRANIDLSSFGDQHTIGGFNMVRSDQKNANYDVVLDVQSGTLEVQGLIDNPLILEDKGGVVQAVELRLSIGADNEFKIARGTMLAQSDYQTFDKKAKLLVETGGAAAATSGSSDKNVLRVKMEKDHIVILAGSAFTISNDQFVITSRDVVVNRGGKNIPIEMPGRASYELASDKAVTLMEGGYLFEASLNGPEMDKLEKSETGVIAFGRLPISSAQLILPGGTGLKEPLPMKLSNGTWTLAMPDNVSDELKKAVSDATSMGPQEILRPDGIKINTENTRFVGVTADGKSIMMHTVGENGILQKVQKAAKDKAPTASVETAPSVSGLGTESRMRDLVYNGETYTEFYKGDVLMAGGSVIYRTDKSKLTIEAGQWVTGFLPNERRVGEGVITFDADGPVFSNGQKAEIARSGKIAMTGTFDATAKTFIVDTDAKNLDAVSTYLGKVSGSIATAEFIQVLNSNAAELKKAAGTEYGRGRMEDARQYFAKLAVILQTADAHEAFKATSPVESNLPVAAVEAIIKLRSDLKGKVGELAAMAMLPVGEKNGELNNLLQGNPADLTNAEVFSKDVVGTLGIGGTMRFLTDFESGQMQMVPDELGPIFGAWKRSSAAELMGDGKMAEGVMRYLGYDARHEMVSSDGTSLIRVAEATDKFKVTMISGADFKETDLKAGEKQSIDWVLPGSTPGVTRTETAEIEMDVNGQVLLYVPELVFSDSKGLDLAIARTSSDAGPLPLDAKTRAVLGADGDFHLSNKMDFGQGSLVPGSEFRHSARNGQMGAQVTLGKIALNEGAGLAVDLDKIFAGSSTYKAGTKLDGQTTFVINGKMLDNEWFAEPTNRHHAMAAVTSIQMFEPMDSAKMDLEAAGFHLTGSNEIVADYATEGFVEALKKAQSSPDGSVQEALSKMHLGSKSAALSVLSHLSSIDASSTMTMSPQKLDNGTVNPSFGVHVTSETLALREDINTLVNLFQKGSVQDKTSQKAIDPATIFETMKTKWVDKIQAEQTHARSYMAAHSYQTGELEVTPVDKLDAKGKAVYDEFQTLIDKVRGAGTRGELLGALTGSKYASDFGAKSSYDVNLSLAGPENSNPNQSFATGTASDVWNASIKAIPGPGADMGAWRATALQLAAGTGVSLNEGDIDKSPLKSSDIADFSITVSDKSTKYSLNTNKTLTQLTTSSWLGMGDGELGEVKETLKSAGFTDPEVEGLIRSGAIQVTYPHLGTAGPGEGPLTLRFTDRYFNNFMIQTTDGTVTDLLVTDANNEIVKVSTSIQVKGKDYLTEWGWTGSDFVRLDAKQSEEIYKDMKLSWQANGVYRLEFKVTETRYTGSQFGGMGGSMPGYGASQYTAPTSYTVTTDAGHKTFSVDVFQMSVNAIGGFTDYQVDAYKSNLQWSVGYWIGTLAFEGGMDYDNYHLYYNDPSYRAGMQAIDLTVDIALAWAGGAGIIAIAGKMGKTAWFTINEARVAVWAKRLESGNAFQRGMARQVLRTFAADVKIGGEIIKGSAKAVEALEGAQAAVTIGGRLVRMGSWVAYQAGRVAGWVITRPFDLRVVTQYMNMTFTMPFTLNAAGKAADIVLYSGFGLNQAAIMNLRFGWFTGLVRPILLMASGLGQGSGFSQFAHQNFSLGGQAFNVGFSLAGGLMARMGEAFGRLKGTAGGFIGRTAARVSGPSVASGVAEGVRGGAAAAAAGAGQLGGFVALQSLVGAAGKWLESTAARMLNPKAFNMAKNAASGLKSTLGQSVSGAREEVISEQAFSVLILDPIMSAVGIKDSGMYGEALQEMTDILFGKAPHPPVRMQANSQAEIVASAVSSWRAASADIAAISANSKFVTGMNQVAEHYESGRVQEAAKALYEVALSQTAPATPAPTASPASPAADASPSPVVQGASADFTKVFAVVQTRAVASQANQAAVVAVAAGAPTSDLPLSLDIALATVPQVAAHARILKGVAAVLAASPLADFSEASPAILLALGTMNAIAGLESGVSLSEIQTADLAAAIGNVFEAAGISGEQKDRIDQAVQALLAPTTLTGSEQEQAAQKEAAATLSEQWAQAAPAILEVSVLAAQTLPLSGDSKAAKASQAQWLAAVSLVIPGISAIVPVLAPAVAVPSVTTTGGASAITTETVEPAAVIQTPAAASLATTPGTSGQAAAVAAPAVAQTDSANTEAGPAAARPTANATEDQAASNRPESRTAEGQVSRAAEALSPQARAIHDLFVSLKVAESKPSMLPAIRAIGILTPAQTAQLAVSLASASATPDLFRHHVGFFVVAAVVAQKSANDQQIYETLGLGAEFQKKIEDLIKDKAEAAQPAARQSLARVFITASSFMGFDKLVSGIETIQLADAVLRGDWTQVLKIAPNGFLQVGAQLLGRMEETAEGKSKAAYAAIRMLDNSNPALREMLAVQILSVGGSVQSNPSAALYIAWDRLSRLPGIENFISADTPLAYVTPAAFQPSATQSTAPDATSSQTSPTASQTDPGRPAADDIDGSLDASPNASVPEAVSTPLSTEPVPDHEQVKDYEAKLSEFQKLVENANTDPGTADEVLAKLSDLISLMPALPASSAAQTAVAGFHFATLRELVTLASDALNRSASASVGNNRIPTAQEKLVAGQVLGLISEMSKMLSQNTARRITDAESFGEAAQFISDAVDQILAIAKDHKDDPKLKSEILQAADLLVVAVGASADRIKELINSGAIEPSEFKTVAQDLFSMAESLTRLLTGLNENGIVLSQAIFDNAKASAAKLIDAAAAMGTQLQPVLLKAAAAMAKEPTSEAAKAELADVFAALDKLAQTIQILASTVVSVESQAEKLALVDKSSPEYKEAAAKLGLRLAEALSVLANPKADIGKGLEQRIIAEGLNTVLFELIGSALATSPTVFDSMAVDQKASILMAIDSVISLQIGADPSSASLLADINVLKARKTEVARELVDAAMAEVRDAEAEQRTVDVSSTAALLVLMVRLTDAGGQQKALEKAMDAINSPRVRLAVEFAIQSSSETPQTVKDILKKIREARQLDQNQNQKTFELQLAGLLATPGADTAQIVSLILQIVSLAANADADLAVSADADLAANADANKEAQAKSLLAAVELVADLNPNETSASATERLQAVAAELNASDELSAELKQNMNEYIASRPAEAVAQTTDSESFDAAASVAEVAAKLQSGDAGAAAAVFAGLSQKQLLLILAVLQKSDKIGASIKTAMIQLLYSALAQTDIEIFGVEGIGQALESAIQAAGGLQRTSAPQTQDPTKVILVHSDSLQDPNNRARFDRMRAQAEAINRAVGGTPMVVVAEFGTGVRLTPESALQSVGLRTTHDRKHITLVVPTERGAQFQGDWQNVVVASKSLSFAHVLALALSHRPNFLASNDVAVLTGEDAGSSGTSGRSMVVISSGTSEDSAEQADQDITRMILAALQY